MFSSILCHGATISFSKISILMQYYRVFPIPNARRVIYLLIFIICGFGISLSLVTIFTCIPVRGSWDLAIQPQAKCLPKFPYVATLRSGILTFS